MNHPAHPDWSRKTYLVIDDFSIVHRMLRDMLRKLGAVAIDTVKNGADAIALLREKPYDVVLCDYNFSEGPNGQQILEEARHRELLGLTCIWLMVSSEKAVETVMGAAEMAPDGYILKPLTDSLLLARLNRAWDRKQAFTAIDRAYAARDYRRAAALCDQGLASTPVHAMDLLRMKAGLLLKAGLHQAARQAYEQALAQREQVWAKAGLARLDCLEGRHADAKQRLLKIVREHPSFLDAYDQLAQTLQSLGETAAALAVLEHAARLSPYAVMRQKNLGDLALQLGKLDVAEQAYQTSIAVGEYSILNSPHAYLGLARLYENSGRADAAVALLATARQRFPDAQVDLPAQIGKSQAHAPAVQEKTPPTPATDPKVQALHQRAQALLRYMETNGYNPVSAEEVRAVLARAEKLAPRHGHSEELLAALQTLGAGSNGGRIAARN
ncbi:response regulator [Noviherbaspirillum sedimenti]|uniref:Response regulator n=1 Tax=Noviherbaspirillum sedimenti TaxID=2320865 RepID=A0A3A3G2T0_9BURK|nr:response regulator [Noviherbaspirillum sedimenti]RJG01129.1 response regulator [Noviherbaspirillum sedimenti]